MFGGQIPMRVPALLYGRIPRFFRNAERQGVLEFQKVSGLGPVA